MEYAKKCPICGNTFTTKKELALYCSVDCRKEARKIYNREYQRKLRATDSRIRREAKKERYQEKADAINKRVEEWKAEFNRKCAAGDTAALLLQEQATHGISTKRYWELYQKSELEAAEKAGEISGRIVNGISIYSPIFADEVLKTIKERGHIRAEINSKQEK